MSELFSKHPALNLCLRFATSRQITESVLRSEIDYGVVANPQAYPGLVVKALATEEVALFGRHRAYSAVIYNPELQQIPNIIRHIVGKKLIPVADYELAARFSSLNPTFAAILPEPEARRFRLERLNPKNFYTARICLIFRAEIPKTARHKAFVNSLTH